MECENKSIDDIKGKSRTRRGDTKKVSKNNDSNAVETLKDEYNNIESFADKDTNKTRCKKEDKSNKPDKNTNKRSNKKHKPRHENIYLFILIIMYCIINF